MLLLRIQQDLAKSPVPAKDCRSGSCLNDFGAASSTRPWSHLPPVCSASRISKAISKPLPQKYFYPHPTPHRRQLLVQVWRPWAVHQSQRQNHSCEYDTICVGGVSCHSSS